MPTGWDFFETGTNANTTYSAGTGSNNTGDTYSYGAASSTERAFGCLRSGSLIPRVGVQFTNSTGGVITTLAISYVGEQWRLGATGRADRLDFQLSTSATSLADGFAGTWADYDALDLVSPVTAGVAGPLNGNAGASRTTVSYTITGLSIANGAAFWIRWSDYDATGADDGLAVDDFSLTVVNNAPTDIALSPNTVPENAAANTVVGAFSTVDPDTGNTFTYTLVAGAGSADNAFFNITAGGNLRTSASFDYEAKNSYAIRVRSTDQGNLWFEKQFTISVSDVGEAPTDIALSNTSLPENAGADAVVGTLSGTDPDAGQSATLTFSLPAGLSDNALFNISGTTLRATASFDYEVSSSYAVTVRATDAVGLTYDETFTITVSDVDEAPTITSDGGGAVAAVSVAENSTAVTTVTATDSDAGTTLTYSIVGGADQAKFTLNGSTGVLTFLSAPDFENPTDADADNVYEVTVEASDGSSSDTQVISVTVSDVNEAPTDIALSNTSLPENAGADAVVGTLSGTDPDAGQSATLTFSLPAGLSDNALFNISGTTLRATASFDYEVSSSYAVTVRATDAVGLTYDETFTITVSDVDEAPTITSDGGGAVAAVSVAENSTAVTTVTATDSDAGTTLTYSIVGGADQAKFTLNGSTGVLTFLSAPDFESPTDADADNVYEVTVEASDGSSSDTQVISVTVSDVAAIYTLSYTAGKGGSIAGASRQTVEPGEDGTRVTAVPKPGYHFYKWSDGLTTASRVDTNVTADKSVEALFAADVVTRALILTYTAGEGGSIAGESVQTVEYGRDGTEVTAVPDPGYRFVGWSDGVATASRTDTEVKADLTVVAEFALAPDRWSDISDQQWMDVYGVTAEQVDAVADGYADGTFRPSLPVNRAQFSKMVVDGFGLPRLSPIVPSFSDVPVAHFFYEWIEGAAGAGIAHGYPNGTFRPDQTITRQQANSILGRHLSQKELGDVGSIQGECGSYASVAEWFVAEGAALLVSFADASQLAPVHAPFTAYLVYHGVVLGSSSGGSAYLTPLSELTRAQAAVLVVRTKQ